MKYLLTILLTATVSVGAFCDDEQKDSEPAAVSVPVDTSIPLLNICHGTTKLPSTISDMFDPVTDKALLDAALGDPGKGGLCQGQVYMANQSVDLTLYRAWNSTNPGSRLGKWWALNKPNGLISDYRTEYEICYQWSPLDKLVECSVNAGTKIVVGTGQSAECSKFLNVPVSAFQQIYIAGAASSMTNCTDFDAFFNWHPSASSTP